MSNKHIGRLQAIGLGRETSSGTPVAASAWIPKTSAEMSPEFEKATDDSAYGVIDEIFDTVTTRNMTNVTIEGIVRDRFIGHLLYAAMGTYYACKFVTITGASGGTPARGDTITSATGTYTGVIRKVVTIGVTTYYAISTTTGTITNQSDLTNGTWTGGTLTIITGVYGHFFSRLNTNDHPAYTVYGSDPVGAEYTSYCMMNTFDMEVAVGDFAKFTAEMMGKKLTTASPQTPSYTSDNAFLAKYAALKLATNEAGLNAASATAVTNFKFSIEKNLEPVQAFGDVDVATIHNQQFTVNGDFEAVYDANTNRDLVANSTKKAARISLINSDATALSSGIYPSLYIDFSRLSFESWSKSNDNNGLVTETVGFNGEFNTTDSMTCEILLLNSNSGTY